MLLRDVSCIPTFFWLFPHEKNFSLLLLSEVSVYPMSIQKASLLPSPLITDVLRSVIMGSSYLAARQSGKCSRVPAQPLTC